MPKYQGELDGLCGMYAIINAYEHCGVEQSDAVFKASCNALAHSRWPGVLWEGTTFGDLQRMIVSCRDTVEGASEVKVSYPFSKKTPRTNVEYWKRLDEIYDLNDAWRCMIIGVSRPWNHWIVATRKSKKRFKFLDSDPRAPEKTKNRSMLHAGSKNGNPNKWIIDRDALAIFEL